MNPPVISVKIESMRHTLHCMISEHLTKLDEHVQAEIERVVTIQNVQGMIQQQAQEVLEEVVKRELNSYFNYGDGRKKVVDLINKAMDSKS